MKHLEQISVNDVEVYQTAAADCRLSMKTIAAEGECFTQRVHLGDRLIARMMGMPVPPARYEVEVAADHVAILLSGKTGPDGLQPFHDQLAALRVQPQIES